jgi:hypothetical protein
MEFRTTPDPSELKASKSNLGVPSPDLATADRYTGLLANIPVSPQLTSCIFNHF